jgi:hypothetical protein
MTSDNKAPEMKSDDMLYAVADLAKNKVLVVTSPSDGVFEYTIPPVEDIKKMWDKLDKDLKNIKKMKEADYVIKKSSEFYMVGMYLKAAMIRKADRRRNTLSGLTQLGRYGSNDIFIRKQYINYKKVLVT